MSEIPAKSDDLVLIRREVLGAACSAIRHHRDAPETLAALKEASMSESVAEQVKSERVRCMRKVNEITNGSTDEAVLIAALAINRAIAGEA